MWRLGFFSVSYTLYDLKNNSACSYLSDYDENVKAININEGFQREIDNKLVFSKLIQNSLPVPDVSGVINGGIISGQDKSIVIFLEDILRIAKQKPLIFKPIDGASGSGVFKLELINDEYVLNGIKKSTSELNTFISSLDNYFISSAVEMASYSKKIFPDSVNTIRLLTMIDNKSGKAFIAAAAHRFGTNKSAPVDNCNAGGITAEINIETGELGAAVSTYPKNGIIEWHNSHPDTGVSIKGVVIPGWGNIKEKILAASNEIPYLKYIGWDIAPLDNGFIVLEGNDGPDIKLHQVHKPLLSDERVLRFYKYNKVI